MKSQHGACKLWWQMDGRWYWWNDHVCTHQTIAMRTIEGKNLYNFLVKAVSGIWWMIRFWKLIADRGIGSSGKGLDGDGGSFQFYLQVTATKWNRKSIMEKRKIWVDCIAFEGLDGSKKMCTLDMVLCLSTLLRCA